jgi:hypothetical protein
MGRHEPEVVPDPSLSAWSVQYLLVHSKNHLVFKDQCIAALGNHFTDGAFCESEKNIYIQALLLVDCNA